MGKLAHIKRQLRQTDQKEREALDTSLNRAVSEGITPSIQAVKDALYAHTVAVKDSHGEGAAKTLKAVQAASEALSRAVNGLVEHVSGIESQIVAEIRAIKFPEIPPQKDVDLSELAKAIAEVKGAVAEPPLIKIPEPVVINEKKEQWTFEFVRNKAGLLEKVIAK